MVVGAPLQSNRGANSNLIEICSHSTVQMWLPMLTNEYLERNMMPTIASRVDVLLKVEDCTVGLSQGTITRVCPKVNLAIPLIVGTLVGPINESNFQKFIYEGTRLYCY